MPYTYLRIALIRRTPSSSCVSFFLLLPARGRPGGNNSVSKEEHHETMRAEIDSKTVGTRLCAQRRAAYPGPRSQGTGAGAFHPLERRPLPALHCTALHTSSPMHACARGGRWGSGKSHASMHGLNLHGRHRKGKKKKLSGIFRVL